MKKYITISFVVAKDSNRFLERLNEEITTFQDKGLQVDIQYETTSNQLTALVCAYKDE